MVDESELLALTISEQNNSMRQNYMYSNKKLKVHRPVQYRISTSDDVSSCFLASWSFSKNS